MANFYDNSIVQKVTGTVHVDNFGSAVPVTGSVSILAVLARTPSMTQVSASITPVLLAAQNLFRKQLWVHDHPGSSILYLGLGGVDIASGKYFLKMAPGSLWELPVDTNVYVGELWGQWDGVIGAASVTEIR